MERLDFRVPVFVIAHLHDGLLRRPIEFTQYTSRAYRDQLALHGVRGSMGRRGNPYDNATMESFMKTLMYEEIYP